MPMDAALINDHGGKEDTELVSLQWKKNTQIKQNEDTEIVSLQWKNTQIKKYQQKSRDLLHPKQESYH